MRVPGEAIKACCDRGLTLKETAAELGISYPTAWRRALKLGLVFQHGGRRRDEDPRVPQMAALYQSGYTLQQVGDQFGLTRERVRQLLTKWRGIRHDDGGQAVQSQRKREQYMRRMDMKTFKAHGCSWAQLCEMRRLGRELMAAGVGYARTPLGAFRSQWNNARNRGIGWELKFWDWWQIWQQSGHWEQRGRGQGYVMSRLNDDGPYALGNVYIAHATENNSQTKNKRHDLPMGVHLVKRGNYVRYVARRMVGSKVRHLGSFKTPELAHAAYLAAAPQNTHPTINVTTTPSVRSRVHFVTGDAA